MRHQVSEKMNTPQLKSLQQHAPDSAVEIPSNWTSFEVHNVGPGVAGLYFFFHERGERIEMEFSRKGGSEYAVFTSKPPDERNDIVYRDFFNYLQSEYPDAEVIFT